MVRPRRLQPNLQAALQRGQLPSWVEKAIPVAFPQSQAEYREFSSYRPSRRWRRSRLTVGTVRSQANALPLVLSTELTATASGLLHRDSASSLTEDSRGGRGNHAGLCAGTRKTAKRSLHAPIVFPPFMYVLYGLVLSLRRFVNVTNISTYDVRYRIVLTRATKDPYTARNPARRRSGW